MYLIITKCIIIVWKRFDDSIVKYFQFHVILSLIIMSANDLTLEVDFFLQYMSNHYISFSNFLFTSYLLILCWVSACDFMIFIIYFLENLKMGYIFLKLIFYTHLHSTWCWFFPLFILFQTYITMSFINCLHTIFFDISSRVSIDFTRKTSQCHVSSMTIF